MISVPCCAEDVFNVFKVFSLKLRKLPTKDIEVVVC